ncbi:peptide ABC transporter substrate-binding protein [Candidatus Tenderia electrophaga]|uniref:Peptide ABC transporter substrate-binding protein n=1 Tax=Candidatus Tenderia electrophaga TaxID=1748243 RepID=A0A0S2THY7_9GAMM|nr:peptide ABC transporter substrate-binding protein [Candidatus Tenderia electrophaga]
MLTTFVRYALLLVLLGALALSGCSRPDPEALRFGLSSSPINLDPRFATDAASTRINRLLYQRLVDFDQNLRPQPSLAEWRRLSPDHYRFHLLMGMATFHNDTALTAADVKATYAAILDPATGSPHRAGLNMIEAIEVIDEQTLDFHLKDADPLFPGRLVIGILPAELLAAQHPFSRQPVGSGPFQFLAWPEEGKLVLERLDDERRFEFITVKNPTVRVLKLLRGEIDMLQNDLPPELVSYLAEQEAIRLRRAPGSNFTYLGFNLEDEDTGRLKLRQAIAHAIDRQAIIEYIMGGAATRASALLPPDHWAGDPDLKLYPYAPARARVLLKEAGYIGAKRPHLVYKTSSDPFRIRLATVIQQQLAEVGIDVELRSYDWGTFYGDIKAGRFQMFSLSWVGIKTPDIFRYVFHSESIPPRGANRGRYFDKLADELIEAAEQKTALDDQARLYAELQARLLQQLPYVPLWYEDHLFAARKGINGYTLARDGNYDGLINVSKDGT